MTVYVLHTHTQTDRHIYIYICIERYIYIHTNAHARTHTQHTHTHKRTHTHTHRHPGQNTCHTEGKQIHLSHRDTLSGRSLAGKVGLERTSDGVREGGAEARGEVTVCVGEGGGGGAPVCAIINHVDRYYGEESEPVETVVDHNPQKVNTITS